MQGQCFYFFEQWFPNSRMLWRISTELVVTSSKRWGLQTPASSWVPGDFFPKLFSKQGKNMTICTYLKVVVFNRRMFIINSKLGKSMIYFFPIYWGTLTSACFCLFAITTSYCSKLYTPYFWVMWGRPKIDGPRVRGSDFSGATELLRVRSIAVMFFDCCTGWYFCHVKSHSPRLTWHLRGFSLLKKKLIFQPLCFNCHDSWSGFCICSGFFQRYPPNIPGGREGGRYPTSTCVPRPTGEMGDVLEPDRWSSATSTKISQFQGLVVLCFFLKLMVLLEFSLRKKIQ